MKFNERLKHFRIQAGLSQRQAAKKIGVPESTYRDWEYGSAIMGEPYLDIAKAFRVTLNELFGLHDHQKNLAGEEIEKIISDLQSFKSKYAK